MGSISKTSYFYFGRLILTLPIVSSEFHYQQFDRSSREGGLAEWYFLPFTKRLGKRDVGIFRTEKQARSAGEAGTHGRIDIYISIYI